MSSETFKIRMGFLIISRCEKLSNILQDAEHTWFSHAECQKRPTSPYQATTYPIIPVRPIQSKCFVTSPLLS